MSDDSQEFLGQEFLTWLWFYGETNNWCIDIPNMGEIYYGIDSLLVMEEDENICCTQRLHGPAPTNSPEADAALKDGKKITTLRVMIEYDEQIWHATWKAKTFNFSSVKLMQPTTNDQEDRFQELALGIETISAIFDKIYDIFLQTRLSDTWGKETLPQMQQWVQTRTPIQN